MIKDNIEVMPSSLKNTDDQTFLKICSILQASEAWEKEALDRCSPFFLMIRSLWLESKEDGAKVAGAR